MTPALFARFPTLESFAGAKPEEVEELVRSCGFYRAKARNIIDMCSMLIRDYSSKVPSAMEDLLRLPGVGRKTANLIRGDVYSLPAVVADTHCIRISNLLGLCSSKDPLKVEQTLSEIIEPKDQNDLCHRFVLHGRAVCIARRPLCERCVLSRWCDHFVQRKEK